ncbi:MAG: FKBP-type peptidyl-prolyl cis-trans isomerase [Methanomassiliicoccaceae archaeon]|nr:FKBP-type peptidyl-prolyl cis-trans isomerase [Methanomassiliicoccaceae archaeon]
MADDDGKVKKERDPIMVVCFVVFIIAVCAITGATVYNNYLKADNTMAVVGSTVSVDYTGTYNAFYGDDNAVVFDTSIWSIANNDNVLKSNDFTLNSQSSYTPLSYTVGGTTVLTIFGNSVIGHKVGDTIQVVVPAGQGYNAASTLSTVSASDLITIPTTEVLTSSQFSTIYGFTLSGFMEIPKSVYGWPATASFNSTNNTVNMNYHPIVGTSYNVVDNDFGKVDLKVTSVTATSISYTYVVSDFKSVSTDGSNINIMMIKVDLGTSVFYITSVTDLDNNGIADSFTTKTVSERYNQDLYFEIKLVSIS